MLPPVNVPPRRKPGGAYRNASLPTLSSTRTPTFTVPRTNDGTSNVGGRTTSGRNLWGRAVPFRTDAMDHSLSTGALGGTATKHKRGARIKSEKAHTWEEETHPRSSVSRERKLTADASLSGGRRQKIGDPVSVKRKPSGQSPQSTTSLSNTNVSSVPTNGASSKTKKIRFADMCRYGDVRAVEAHLSHVAKSRSITEQSEAASQSTAIHAATEGGISVLRVLLKHGFNPNVRRDGKVPLITAVKAKIRHGTNSAWQQYDVLDILTCLVSGKAQVDLRDNEGRTALWWASKYNNQGAVERLLLLGANESIPDKRNVLPIDATSCRAVRAVMLPEARDELKGSLAIEDMMVMREKEEPPVGTLEDASCRTHNKAHSTVTTQATSANSFSNKCPLPSPSSPSTASLVEEARGCRIIHHQSNTHHHPPLVSTNRDMLAPLDEVETCDGGGEEESMHHPPLVSSHGEMFEIETDQDKGSTDPPFSQREMLAPLDEIETNGSLTPPCVKDGEEESSNTPPYRAEIEINEEGTYAECARGDLGVISPCFSDVLASLDRVEIGSLTPPSCGSDWDGDIYRSVAAKMKPSAYAAGEQETQVSHQALGVQNPHVHLTAPPSPPLTPPRSPLLVGSPPSPACSPLCGSPPLTPVSSPLFGTPPPFPVSPLLGTPPSSPVTGHVSCPPSKHMSIPILPLGKASAHRDLREHETSSSPFHQHKSVKKQHHGAVACERGAPSPSRVKKMRVKKESNERGVSPRGAGRGAPPSQKMKKDRRASPLPDAREAPPVRQIKDKDSMRHSNEKHGPGISDPSPPFQRPLESFFTHQTVDDLRNYHSCKDAVARLAEKGFEIIDYPPAAPIAVLKVRGSICMVQMRPLVVRGPTGETLRAEYEGKNAEYEDTGLLD